MIDSGLGHYEIIESLGAGGMGEVYRAHDGRLKRDVALKVLPENFADDPERLARLEREAHLLAALNHSNIATIYSLEEAGDTRFLVMELVKGQSLEALLADGPLPIDEALDICRQIAEALEAAHKQGIIHRDLKPANVLVTSEGQAKVLDFGLAKTIERADAESDLSHSPTITIAATEAGVILGTAPYMSPEQVRGRRLDKRADIWAFGCVLFEALTGEKAFNRETVADTLAAILEVEPLWDDLPAATPAAIRQLIGRCLRKNPKRRLHDIADARIEIEEALEPALVGASGGVAAGAVAGTKPFSGARQRARSRFWSRAQRPLSAASRSGSACSRSFPASKPGTSRSLTASATRSPYRPMAPASFTAPAASSGCAAPTRRGLSPFLSRREGESRSFRRMGSGSVFRPAGVSRSSVSRVPPRPWSRTRVQTARAGVRIR